MLDKFVGGLSTAEVDSEKDKTIWRNFGGPPKSSKTYSTHEILLVGLDRTPARGQMNGWRENHNRVLSTKERKRRFICVDLFSHR